MIVKRDDDGKKKQAASSDQPDAAGKPQLTAGQLNVLKQRCEHDNIEFYYRATDRLKHYIIQGHPITDQLPDLIKSALLAGKGIAVTREMIYRWISGSLDRRNAFILEHAEIRVENDPMTVIRKFS